MLGIEQHTLRYLENSLKIKTHNVAIACTARLT